MKDSLTFKEGDQAHTLPLLGISDLSLPKRLIIADDQLKADVFYRQASEGAGFLWRGDFQNAKQLLSAVQRRIDKAGKRQKTGTLSPQERFHRYRLARVHRAQLLSRLLVEVSANLKIELPRAPDVTEAIKEALGPQKNRFLISLRELLGFIGAHEWRTKGLHVDFLGQKIFPHFGVFAPIRSEYLDLIIKAPLPPNLQSALDVGTGTGILAAILLKRGFKQVTATDCEPRAIACAGENLKKMGVESLVHLVTTDQLPEGQFDLIICNPPWLPVRPTSALERSVYDPDHSMLKSVLDQARNHLKLLGEVWILISDLAEHLGLRDPDQLEKWFAEFNYEIVGRESVHPTHLKSQDQEDPLFFARSKEVTSLWRLRQRKIIV